MALLHHAVHAPRGDYVGLGVAAFLSWVGIPGPGEAALVTAGTLAAKGQLHLLTVVGVAWLGAHLGGLAGWFVGHHAGHAVASGPGPLQRARIRALDHGRRFYHRYGVLAVFFTPSWIAGINRMPARRFFVANALAALAWALLWGLGAALVGPSIADFAGDLGLVGTIAVAVLTVVAVVAALRRRGSHSHPRSD